MKNWFEKLQDKLTSEDHWEQVIFHPLFCVLIFSVVMPLLVMYPQFTLLNTIGIATCCIWFGLVLMKAGIIDDTLKLGSGFKSYQEGKREGEELSGKALESYLNSFTEGQSKEDVIRELQDFSRQLQKIDIYKVGK